jgi:hypothetical protein
MWHFVPKDIQRGHAQDWNSHTHIFLHGHPVQVWGGHMLLRGYWCMPVLCLAGAIMMPCLVPIGWWIGMGLFMPYTPASMANSSTSTFIVADYGIRSTLSHHASHGLLTLIQRHNTFWTARKTGDISSMWEQGSLTTMTLIMEPSLRTSMRGIRQRCKHTGDSTSISHKVGWECDKHNIKMASQVQLILRSTVPWLLATLVLF